MLNLKALKAVNIYFSRYRWRLAFGIVFIVLSNYFGVLAPGVIRQAIDTIIAEARFSNWFSDTDARAAFNAQFYRHVLMFTGLAVLFALLRGVFLFFTRQTIIVMSRHIEFDQKNDIYRHLQQLDYDFYKRSNTGDLMTRITEDVSRVRMYTGPGVMYTLNLIVLSGLVVYRMFEVAPTLTLYAVLPLPVMLMTIYYVNQIVERKSELIQAQLSNLTTMAQETFSGIRVIKAFVQENNFIGRFAKESEEYRSRTLSMVRTDAFFYPVMLLLVGMSTIITIFVGGRQVINGEITPGVIAEFIIYINMVTWPFAMVGWVSALIQRAAVSQERINRIMETQPSMTFGAVNEKELNGLVEFRNVSYTYPNTGITAITNINFTLQPGERLAVVGKTGSGKSTLAALLTRMFDVTNGDVLIDNRNIQQYTADTLRRNLAYVPQDVFLFSDTIANNIAFGETANGPELNKEGRAAVEQASVSASFHQEAMVMPKGYETVIGERGITLSGGQKQRVSIARALMRDAPILVLDDCLSAVDANTEREIFHNLLTFIKNRTTVLVTHRVSAAAEFDRILVLQHGEMVELGTHDELMRRNGYYKKMVDLQNKNENLLS